MHSVGLAASAPKMATVDFQIDSVRKQSEHPAPAPSPTTLVYRAAAMARYGKPSTLVNKHAITVFPRGSQAKVGHFVYGTKVQRQSRARDVTQAAITVGSKQTPSAQILADALLVPELIVTQLLQLNRITMTLAVVPYAKLIREACS